MGGSVKKPEDPYGDSELISFCRNGNVEQINKFLEDKNNLKLLNDKNNDGNTALMVAIIKGYPNISKLLLEIPEINLSIKNKWGDTALILTCRCGQLDICRLIVSKGVDINYQNKKGETALMNSIIKGYKDITECLLTSNVNLLLITRDGNTILHYLCEKGWFELCQTYFSLSSTSTSEVSSSLPSPTSSPSSSLIDHINQAGESALHLCCKSNSFHCCEILLQHGSNINLRTYSGDSPLMLACLNECLENVSLLLTYKSLLNYQNNNGQTALHLLIEKKNINITKYILNYNRETQFQSIDFNLRNNHGNTFLHLIVQYQLIDLLDYIIQLYHQQLSSSSSSSSSSSPLISQEENRIDWNVQNHTGDTLLLIACKNKFKECIKLLLTIKQLNIKIRNKKGHNIYSFNKDNIYNEIIQKRITEFGEDEEFNNQ